MVRINKYLAQCNLGSRRKVERFVTSGRIKVNGKKMIDLAYQVDTEKDVVEFDNKQVEPSDKMIYLMMNKPKNYLTTKKDKFNRRIVYDLLPDFDMHIFSIGRLDYLSEGLLLFTSDGDFANKIIHPRYKLSKTYKVLIKGKLSHDQIEHLRNGVMINNRKTKKAKVFVNKVKTNTSELKMIIYEGRKRQIRRMIKKIGSEVLELKRLQIGNLKLGSLPPGMWRVLKPEEVLSLRKLVAGD